MKNHPTDEQLLELAEKVAHEESLSDDDKSIMHHVVDCDECYQLMMCMMALIDATENIGKFATSPIPSISF